MLNVFLGNGNDQAYGGKNTNIFGGDGEDYIQIQGGNAASGGDGNDNIYIAAQYDYDTQEWRELSSEIYGGLGNDYVTGGYGDTLHGGDGNDTLDANYGNGFLYGGNGDDSISGGEGADWLSGGNDNDTILASDNGNSFENNDATGFNDTLNGGAGNDTLMADREGHSLFGGSGSDILTVTINSDDVGGQTMLYGGSGDDFITAAGNSMAEGGAGSDIFTVDLRTNDYTQNNTMFIADFTLDEDKLSIISDFGTHEDISASDNYRLSASFATNEEYGEHTVVRIFSDEVDDFIGTAFILDGYVFLRSNDYLDIPDVVV